LILLDIGLPKLNGIEAARQIRKSAPQSRIIFVSQESSLDIVQEAISLGTCRYDVKSKAEHDILATVDAVLEGRQFLRGASAEQFTDAIHGTSSYDASTAGSIPSLKHPQLGFGNCKFREATIPNKPEALEKPKLWVCPVLRVQGSESQSHH